MRHFSTCLLSIATVLSACGSEDGGKSLSVAATNGSGSTDVGVSQNSAEPTGGENVGDGQILTLEQTELRKSFDATQSRDAADLKLAGKIEPGAIDHYTRAEYPDVVRRWGKQIKRIDTERTRSAHIAAADPHCDGVINAQVSDKSTNDDHRYWIECNNITRFYFDTASLRLGKPAHIQTEADMGNNGLLSW